MFACVTSLGVTQSMPHGSLGRGSGNKSGRPSICRLAFRCNVEYHYIGYFHEKEEAARAYDAAILSLAGEFARLYFPKTAWQST